MKKIKMASTGGSSTRQTRVTTSGSKSEPKIVKLTPVATSISSGSATTSESSVSSTQGEAKTTVRREVLIRQPSYCKILDDLKGTEANVANLKQEAVESAVDHEADEAEETLAAQQVQTISINGQQYQIVSPIGVDGVQTLVGATSSSSTASAINSSVVQYAASTQNGQTVFIPGTVAAATASAPQIISVATAVAPSGSSSSGGNTAEETTRKREIRLLKNREAARECRNKKKEYIKCLENRVGKSESIYKHN